MADVVAVPKVSSMVVPQGFAVNELFDWNVILGVPFWLFITCFFIFCLAAVWIYWFARMRKLNAVKGWKESLSKMSPADVQVWLFTRTQKLIIGCMKIEDNVLSYYDEEKIGMWHHNMRESMIGVGGNPAVVVSEDYDQTRDIISEIVLTDASDEFNANQKALQDQYKKEGNPTAVIQPINSYSDYEDYGRETLQILHPDGLPMKIYNVFSSSKFLKYFPKGCSHTFFGGELAFDARGLVMHRKEQGFWAKYTITAVAALIVLAAIAAAWFVPL